MGLWSCIFGTAQQRQDKRIALKAWKNLCRWGSAHIKVDQRSWLSVGNDNYVSTDDFLLSHMSVQKLLGRDRLIEYWIPRIEHDAIAMVHRDKDVLLRWADIDDAQFWMALKEVLTQPLQAQPKGNLWGATPVQREFIYWTKALEGAGICGNVLPFEMAPKHVVKRYMGNLENAVHPRVGLWAAAQGLCTMEHLRAQVDATYTISGGHFGPQGPGKLIAPDFAREWCVLLLRDYGLSLSQRVGVVAQALLAFGQDAWERELASACAPFLDGIDMQVVYLLCHADVPNMQGHFERTLWMAAQHPKHLFATTSTLHFAKGVVWPDVGLGLFLDYTPPKNRLELYFMAVQAKNAALGPPEMLALPALD